MPPKTIRGILKDAHHRIETATDDLHMALALAKQHNQHAILLRALHNATIRATQLAAHLEPILSTLALPTPPGNP